ncbi:MAG: nickel pincer cofactor biosynthesis protein LarC [Blastocatellia bacterium]|nr:MAG: nickel pincer cofactor biosynthesis protein LarC [Blastocatellia bacterium]
MSRVLYFDCFSGISGDMVLGALIDAGLPLNELKAALGSLAISGYDVDARRVLRAGVSATKFGVHEHNGRIAAASNQQYDVHHDHGQGHHHGDEEHHAHSHPHRSLPEIYALIDQSALPQAGRARAKALFQRLAEVEASIHQMPVEQVHLHEVGALDSIIDVVGAVFAIEWFSAERIVCSPLNVGGGMVKSAHGTFPVPSPATIKLLGDAPVYGGPIQKELVTPTGALLASAYASSFGPIPAMAIEQVGYGAGDHDFPTTPNVLRVLVGRATDRPTTDRVTVLECEIDDMNPQLFGVTMERLYAAGALEVFYVPVQMKKNRPGTLLSVVAPPTLRARLAEIIFQETTTIGLRHFEVDRECLQREIVVVQTPVGPVRFKVAWREGRVVNAAPEFEDCARLAADHNLSVKEIQALAVKAYRRD